jgi:hypothetical protein
MVAIVEDHKHQIGSKRSRIGRSPFASPNRRSPKKLDLLQSVVRT